MIQFLDYVFNPFISEDGSISIPKSFKWTTQSHMYELLRLMKALFLPSDPSNPGTIGGFAEGDFSILNPDAGVLKISSSADYLKKVNESVSKSRDHLRTIHTTITDFSLHFDEIKKITSENMLDGEENVQ
ncbi:uncharacterized protein MONOS_154 [Monocercomonoides exilis]|uniref:uncharacterized protein n=1 Tax=Monocercomonoides exilis TaxID=2049356 RepID=UPI003559D8EE|nr:hypothetical protein MONOS_154 [Monocercomonoides exilis]